MITYRIFKDKEKCRKVWDRLSPKKHLWDLWEFRECFYSGEILFHFIVAYDGPKPVGLIPLVYIRESAEYIYFGDLFPEQNKFFIKDKKLVKDLLEQCPYETALYYIDPHEATEFELRPAEKRYFLDLKKYDHDASKYLMTFNKKHRKNLRYDLRKLKEKGVEIVKNDLADFELMSEFNQQSFDTSDYNDEKFEASMKRLMEFANEKKMLDMISLRMKGKTYAIGIGVVYNKTYYVVAMGRDIYITNIGKLLIFEQIKSAIENNCDSIDFLSTESGWKELWNLDSEQMYEWGG